MAYRRRGQAGRRRATTRTTRRFSRSRRSRIPTRLRASRRTRAPGSAIKIGYRL